MTQREVLTQMLGVKSKSFSKKKLKVGRGKLLVFFFFSFVIDFLLFFLLIA